MIDVSLPPALRAALERQAHGLSLRDAARRAAAQSAAYRSGGTSGRIIDDGDALAYALARMPATYAAVIASLDALAAARPDLAPASLLDVGAGPGTATWAAAQVFSSLDDFTLIDANAALRRLALALLSGEARFARLAYALGDAASAIAAAPPGDLAIMSYVAGELGDEARAALVDALWAKTRDTLLIVEPGTPAGYGRVIALRARLIAEGAFVAAPCPHDAPCPLAPPDWCHFAQRLPRSRAHREIKEAAVPFEDEKFSYVALTRQPPARPAARVLAQPLVTKAEVTMKLCRAEGDAALVKVPRRDKTAYAAARRRDWGDAAER